MANDTYVTIVGNVVDEPELRFTTSGAAVANFRVASTPRKFDKTTSKWTDEDALFLSVTIWRQAAENLVESITKGSKVIVYGRLKQRSYTTRDGDKRTAFEVDAEEVGAALSNAVVKISKVSRASQTPPPAQDAWTTPAPDAADKAPF